MTQLYAGAGSSLPAPHRPARAELRRALERVNVAGARFGGAALARVGDRLAGPATPRPPKDWGHLTGCDFVTDTEATLLDLDELQAVLTVAVLISTHPDSMPRNLVDDVELLVARVEAAIHGTPAGVARVELAGDDRTALEFLHHQTLIRRALPLRTRLVCRVCRNATVTNPDYQRIVKRNQRLRNLVGGVGATVGTHGISPFVALGTALKFAKLDPDYVCQRCQGTSADERVVTFCPQCGGLRLESVLRTCATCRHDFRTDAAPALAWRPFLALAAPVMAIAAPGFAQLPPGATLPLGVGALVPMRGVHGGKLCSDCGGEFASLWRVVVGAPGAGVVRFVCGGPSCSAPSQVPPVAV